MEIEDFLDEYSDVLDYIELEYKYSPEELIDTFGLETIIEFFKRLEDFEDFEEAQREIDLYFTQYDFESNKRRRRS